MQTIHVSFEPFFAVCSTSPLQVELFSPLSTRLLLPPPRISFVLEGERVETLLGWVEARVDLDSSSSH